MINKLSKLQKQQIKYIAKKHGLVFAVIFGSKTKGQKKPESDLDIAVLVKKKPSYKVFKSLFSELSEVFKGENVDLRFLNDADPFFRYQVVSTGELLFGNLSEYNLFKIYANKVYIDDGRKYFPYLEKLIYKRQLELERSQTP